MKIDDGQQRTRGKAINKQEDADMVRNQKAETYNEKRRYKVYGIWNGKWQILGFASTIEKANEKYLRWTEEDGAYQKASERVIKMVDTKTNEVVKSQNC